MKYLIKSIVLLVFINFYSCGILEDDCEGYACFTPGKIFYFELIDKTTEQNIFTSGAYTLDDLSIIDLDTNEEIAFDFAEDNGLGLDLIQVDNFWNTAISNYSFKLNDDQIFTLYVDAESVSEDCCSFTRYNEITISNTDFTLSENKEVYEILID